MATMDVAPAQSRPPRPVAVIVIAIVAIAFGVLGLVCTPFGALPYVSNAGQPNPIVDAVKARPVLFGWTIFSLFLSFALSVALVAGGVGVLGLRRWARLLLIVESSISILLNCVGTGVSAVVLYPIMRGMGEAVATAGLLGGGCGLAFNLLVSGSILAVLVLPSVRQAFAASA